jgi:FkbM family methyltransferase
MDYSNHLLLQIRLLLGKKLGLLRPIVRFVRRIRHANYEEQFDFALLKSVSASDTVWDVGANKGYYTEQLARLVPSGAIVAFEPSPETFNYLNDTFGSMPNVHLENVALSDQDGEVSFFISNNSHEDSLFNKADGLRPCVLVRAAKADSFLHLFPPDVVKIDVEGFELEVMRGMSEVLLSSRLKCIFIEVHFSILADRGQKNAPKEIVALLKDAGMSVKWLDPSHLVATRT